MTQDTKQTELEEIVSRTQFSMDEFLELADLKGVMLTTTLEQVLCVFATCLITISNLTFMNDKYKEDIESINLRLDLANVPREDDSAEIIQIQNGKNIKERTNDDN